LTVNLIGDTVHYCLAVRQCSFTFGMFLYVIHVSSLPTGKVNPWHTCQKEKEKAMVSEQLPGLIPADAVIGLMAYPDHLKLDERIRRYILSNWQQDGQAAVLLEVLDKYYEKNDIHEYPNLLKGLYGEIEEQVEYRDKAYWAPILRIAILSRILRFWDIEDTGSGISRSCFFFVNRTGRLEDKTRVAYKKMFRDRLAGFKGNPRALDYWIFDLSTSSTVTEILCHARIRLGGVDLMKQELRFLSFGFHDISEDAVSYLSIQMARIANAESGFRNFREKLFELIKQRSDQVINLRIYRHVKMRFLVNDGDFRVEVDIRGGVPLDIDKAKVAAEEIVRVLEKYIHQMERKFKLCITLVDKIDDDKTAILFEQGLDCPF